MPDVQQIVATSSAETCRASTCAASAARDSVVSGRGHEGQAAFRRVGTQAQDLQRAPLAQLHGAGCVVRALQRAHGQRRSCAGQVDDLLQFVAPELHRHRADDDAEPQRSEVQRRILRDVRQLRDQDVVAPQAELQQSQGVTVGEVRDVLEREP